MKSWIIRTSIVLAGISIFLLIILFASMGKQPEYFLLAAEDDDIVEAYRAYFELNDTMIKMVKVDNYNARILSRNTKYYELEQTTYSFEAYAHSANPSKWEYTQNQFDKEDYDQEKLIKYLKMMKVFYTGDVNIQISEFNNYTVIEVQNIKEEEIVDIKTGLFKNNSIIELPEGITLKSLSKVYKLKE